MDTVSPLQHDGDGLLDLPDEGTCWIPNDPVLADRGSVTSCIQYCTIWEVVCSMKTATGRPRPRRRSRVWLPRTTRRLSTTQLQVT